MQRKDAKLLDGRTMSCAYEIDSAGFILYSIHGAGGDLTVISAEEYDNVEAQVMGEPHKESG